MLRPLGYWSPSVHELLKHLEKQGFDGAPKFLGIDESRREILTYIPGEVPGNSYPTLPPYMWSDSSLVRIARLLRRYHDATVGFVVNAESHKWQGGYFGNGEQEVICHNDAALYNIVSQNGNPHALIDFDMAGPGPRMWDIAYTVYTSVPLAGFSPDYVSGTTVTYSFEMHAAERRRRIALFFESYGVLVPADFEKWVIERLESLCDTLRVGAAQGSPVFQKMVDEGHLAHYENEVDFLRRNFTDWL